MSTVVVGTAEGRGAQAQPPRETRGGGNPPQAPTEYSGIGAAHRCLGHNMYDPEIIAAELKLQSNINGNQAKRTAFRNFSVNYTQLQMYLAMAGAQVTVTMIHTPGAYYSIKSATNGYQGRVLAFIGDRRTTKEPTPICLRMDKMWQWFTGKAIIDDTKLLEYHGNQANLGTLWKPTANEGTAVDVKVPHLLAIPNILVNVLRNQGTVATPADVLTAVDKIIASAITPKTSWDLIHNWCMVAGQAGNNNKSHIFLDIDSVTINDKEFDLWVGQKLDSNLGPRPAIASASQQGTPNQAADYVNFSQILATSVGSSMLQFTQAVLPSAVAGPATPLEMGKGFNKDQIAKLKDACGVIHARAIPNIWFVIQSTKGKSCGGGSSMAAVVSARQKRGGGEQRGNGVCGAVLAAAARWRRWQSGGCSAAAAQKRRAAGGNGNGDSNDVDGDSNSGSGSNGDSDGGNGDNYCGSGGDGDSDCGDGDSNGSSSGNGDSDGSNNGGNNDGGGRDEDNSGKSDGGGYRQQSTKRGSGRDNSCGDGWCGRQRHARLGGGLQWGRDVGGKKRRRQLSGNDGCDGGRPRRRTTTAIADNDGGGRQRRRMKMVCMIRRRTMTGKDKSGRQEMAETAKWR